MQEKEKAAKKIWKQNSRQRNWLASQNQPSIALQKKLRRQTASR
jgi:hypothetical protein